MTGVPSLKDFYYLATMSQRRRYANFESRVPRVHTPLGISVHGLSVPVGCIHQFAGPMTFDNGNTWFDSTTGLRLVQTVQPRIGIDIYGNAVPVMQQTFMRPVSPLYTQSQQQRSVSPPQQQYVAPPRQQYVAPPQQQYVAPPRQQYVAPPQVYVQPVPVKQQPPRQNQIHSSIIETGTFDRFGTGRELVLIKNEECWFPKGKREYIFDYPRKTVTVKIIKEVNGAEWSGVYSI
jgi:hypothetical protein